MGLTPFKTTPTNHPYDPNKGPRPGGKNGVILMISVTGEVLKGTLTGVTRKVPIALTISADTMPNVIQRWLRYNASRVTIFTSRGMSHKGFMNNVPGSLTLIPTHKSVLTTNQPRNPMKKLRIALPLVALTLSEPLLFTCVSFYSELLNVPEPNFDMSHIRK